ncbi:hypothetical protein AKJ16_DCAP15971 [Drosera capensis]
MAGIRISTSMLVEFVRSIDPRHKRPPRPRDSHHYSPSQASTGARVRRSPSSILDAGDDEKGAWPLDGEGIPFRTFIPEAADPPVLSCLTTLNDNLRKVDHVLFVPFGSENYNFTWGSYTSILETLLAPILFQFGKLG